MAYDISQSISQGSSGEETQENRRILEVATELSRRCKLYEAQLRDGEKHVSFEKKASGRFEDARYEAWDLVPRNVLKDVEGDIFIIDAEIKIKE